MKKATITAALMSGMLLLGAGVATAAPRVPIGPSDIAVPTAPPEPDPCSPKKYIPCDLPTLIIDEPTEPEEPTDIANPTVEPSEPTEPSQPGEPNEPSEPPATTTVVTTTQQQPVGRPAEGPSGIPTPTRIDTGAGPVDPGSVNWWLIAVPVLALLALAASGTLLWIQRTERRPS